MLKNMLNKIKSIKFILSICLIISLAGAIFATYYKVKYWGFSFTPRQTENIWNIETNISFMPNGENIKVSITAPIQNNNYKIIDDNVVAPNYVSKKDKKNNKIVLTAKAKEQRQNIYYRVLLLDHKKDAKTKEISPNKPKLIKPNFDQTELELSKTIISMAKEQNEKDLISSIIKLLNQNPVPSAVSGLIPFKISQEELATIITKIISVEKIASRSIKGVYLVESKRSILPDYMIETYRNDKRFLYNINTGKRSSAENFIILAKGNEAIIDIEGGEESSIQYSVLKSTTSTFDLAKDRAKLDNTSDWFEMSIFNLPFDNQSTIKWLSIFPLAILVIVVLRNIIGIKTMGTFTPMLISLSLVQTGFTVGMVAFIILISIGMLLRTLLSKLDLLLVPRISAIVIFVIIIMHIMTIIGYQMKLEIALATVFFPIIIIAWIIERASITWEEDGALNSTKEIISSLFAAALTYAIISNEYIRHISFAFYEFNIVILFIVMLIGTYTGYRLTELKRFSPLIKKSK